MLNECCCLMMGWLAIGVVVCVWVCPSISEVDGGALDEVGGAPVGVAAAGTDDGTVADDVGAAFSSLRMISRISFLILSLSAIDIVAVVVIVLVPALVVAGPTEDVGVDMAHW